MQRCSRRKWLAAGAAVVAGLAAPRAAAQGAAFPNRPITLLVPFAPGGIADLTARAVAEVMARSLGQPLVVDNKPSAGSILASQAVAQARPDGHTLLLMSNSNALSATLFKKLPYDTLKDFAPISTLGFFDIGLFVAAASPLLSVKDLLAYARAHPGKLTIGSIAVGSTQHLGAELFKSVTGIDALVVPYKATPAVISALRAGEIDLAFEIVGPMLGQLSGAALRVLAVSSDKRSPALPDTPTVQEAGVAGYAVASWNALAVAAHTPPEVIARLNAAAREAVAAPAVRDKLGRLGMRLAASTPADMQALLSTEIKRWAEVIRAARIEPE